MTGKKETAYAFLLAGLSKVFTYILLLILANFFVKEVYGQVSFVMAIFRIAIFFSLMGIPDVLVPWLIKRKDAHSIFYFLFFINILFTFIGVLIALKYLWVLPIVLIQPFLFFRGIGRVLLQKEHKYHLLEFFNTLYPLIAAILVYFFRDWSRLGILLGYAISYSITSIGMVLPVKKGIIKIMKKFKLDFIVVWDYFKKSFVTSTITLSFLFLGWIDSVILGWLSTFENVAMYNIASPISNLIATIPYSISFFLLTRIAELKDYKKRRRVLSRSLRISYSSSLLLAILLNSLIFFLIKIFFPRYVGVEFYFMILSIGVLFYSLYSLIYVDYLGELKPEKGFFPIIFASVLNVVLDILLIPKYGLLGITAATTVAHLSAFIWFSLKKNLFKEFVLSYLFVLFVPLSFYLKFYGLLMLPLVFVLLLVFKMLRFSDLKVLYDIFLKIKSDILK